MAYVIKPEHLAAIAGASTPLMPALADWMNQTCPGYEIDSPQEHCHFLAQACHETDHFRDVSPFEFISITINGGYNGMDERKKYYALAQSVLT